MFKRELDREHGGFAITLEVLATLVMFCVFVNFILYFTNVMNVQRYMNTVMTSTAVEASRWGGVNSKAYSNNISSTPLLTSAQSQLNAVASSFNATITGWPATISHDNEEITIRISYSLPTSYSSLSKVNSVSGDSFDMFGLTSNMTMQVSVKSIMEAGKLL